MELPEILIKKHQGFNVVRDDLLPGGTKQRVLTEMLAGSKKPDFVYPAHPYGHGAVALAHATKSLGYGLALFYPKVFAVSRMMNLAIKHRHVSYYIVESMEKQTDLVQIAKDYAEFYDSVLLPVGFDMPEFSERLIELARGLPIVPDEVWTVAGSGCLARALCDAWPNANVNAVSLGFDHLNAGRAKVHLAPETAEQAAMEMPPYPSSEYYDAKVWKFAKEMGSEGALIWNVA